MDSGTNGILNIDEIPIYTGIIDYGSNINGGISIYISITIYDFTFQASYWIHPNGNTLLECEPDFLKLWGIEDSQNLPFYDELCEDIESIIPNRKEIFNELL